MGLIDHVVVEEDVDLPEYPDELSRDGFQTKDVHRPASNVYRISNEGRLEERRRSYREKTSEEKQEYAEENDFGSWDAMVAAYEEAQEEDGGFGVYLDRGVPFGGPDDETVDNEWWVDQEWHGIVRISHCFPVKDVPDEPSRGHKCYEYDLKFTEGQLVDITRTDRR